MRIALSSILAAFALIFGLAACGGVEGLDQALLDAAPEDLELDEASCPDDIDQDVGYTFECTATNADGDEFDVPAEVTDVTDDEVEATFDFSQVAAGGATGESGS